MSANSEQKQISKNTCGYNSILLVIKLLVCLVFLYFRQVLYCNKIVAVGHLPCVTNTCRIKSRGIKSEVYKVHYNPSFRGFPIVWSTGPQQFQTRRDATD